MTFDMVPLARQVDEALREMEEELKGLSAGTIVFQIRNDDVGKFGIRHLPLEFEDKSGDQTKPSSGGLSAEQIASLRRLAVEALVHKRKWTHGEITYDFALRQGKLNLSVQFESNYNMANLMFRLKPKRRSGEQQA